MLTPEARAELIALYGRGVDMLRAALTEFPAEMWQFKPDPASWSIHEILIHLGDSESNSFARFRAPIAEPGVTIFAYDQDVWAQKLDYHEQNWQDSVELLHWIHKMTYDFIVRLPDEVWAQTVFHPESGIITLDDVLVIYANHIPEHIQQMRENFAVWKGAQG
jgi:hypothetical protein